MQIELSKKNTLGHIEPPLYRRMDLTHGTYFPKNLHKGPACLQYEKC